MTGHLFLKIPGPTAVPESVMRAMARPLINHRGAEFGAFVKGLLPRVQQVFRTASGTPIIFPSSGTGATESAVINVLSPGDAVLAFTIGNFSGGFAEIARRMGVDVTEEKLPWGSGIPADLVHERLAADTGHRFRAVLAIHNETSTGVTTDLKAVRDAMDRAGHPALLLVDTVSGLGSADFRFDEWGIDVAVAGSQKGLLLPPGLGVLCVSDKALAAMERVKTPRAYFDWAPMVENNRKGFFPYTPATGLLFGLEEALNLLFGEGLDNVFARHARLGEGVRRAVNAWGLELVAQNPADYSPVLTAVYTPEGIDADKLIALTESRLNLALGNGLGPLGGRAFRIGHLGWTNEVETLGTLAGVELGLRMMGADIVPGSGVAACQTYLLETA